VTGATYLINAALLKGHSLAAVTLCAKNHFGSVYREGTGPNRSYQGWSPSNMHDAIMTETRPMGTYNPLVDLMGHKDLGGKTILYLIEGFYAALHQSVPAQKWQSPPFNGHWTASLFVSQDPWRSSRWPWTFSRPRRRPRAWSGPWTTTCTRQPAGQPPALRKPATTPRATGTMLQSLGVHEHWNSPEKKQYSRNLGTGKGIELLKGE